MADETNTPDLEGAADADFEIEAIYADTCPSLSERSDIQFEVGRHPKAGTLHFRLANNSGRGMFCDEWASLMSIDEVVVGASRLTAKAMNAVHPGKSVNTGGFLLACLRHLGIVRVKDDNSRLHEHVPTTSLERSVEDLLRQQQATTSTSAKRGKRQQGV
ncbi:hypothetical protein ACS5PK_22305 [Roseateles sp. DB2]|uniref:hypothetical protein n=1 Tax=Roseateles sp. DB2 TaxID=3453717 RepID=UPI003EECD5FE